MIPSASQQVTRINISDIPMLSTTIKLLSLRVTLVSFSMQSWQCLHMSLHSVDPDSFNSDSYVHSSGHSIRKLSRHWLRRSYLVVWTTAIRFCSDRERQEESPVAAECRSTPHHWRQTSWPHYAFPVSAALASCSAASGVQTRLSGAPGIVRSNAYMYLANDIHLVSVRRQPTIPSVFLW